MVVIYRLYLFWKNREKTKLMFLPLNTVVSDDSEGYMKMITRSGRLYYSKLKGVRTYEFGEISYGSDESKVSFETAARFIRHWVGVKERP